MRRAGKFREVIRDRQMSFQPKADFSSARLRVFLVRKERLISHGRFLRSPEEANLIFGGRVRLRRQSLQLKRG